MTKAEARRGAAAGCWATHLRLSNWRLQRAGARRLSIGVADELTWGGVSVVRQAGRSPAAEARCVLCCPAI